MLGVTASFTFPPCTADLAELVRELPGAGNAHAYRLVLEGYSNRDSGLTGGEPACSI